jgi:hypothetical protein
MNYKEQKIAEIIKKQNDKELHDSIMQLNTLQEEIALKWGNERIMKLISPELLVRYQRALNKYKNEYLSGNKIELIQMMIRANQALIHDVQNKGYNELSPEFIFVQHPETKQQLIICTKKDDIPVAHQKYKEKEDVIIFDINELLTVIDKNILSIKKATHKVRGTITKYESIN